MSRSDFFLQKLQVLQVLSVGACLRNSFVFRISGKQLNLGEAGFPRLGNPKAIQAPQILDTPRLHGPATLCSLQRRLPQTGNLSESAIPKHWVHVGVACPSLAISNMKSLYATHFAVKETLFPHCSGNQRSLVHPHPSAPDSAGGNSNHCPSKTQTKNQTTAHTVFTRERRN